MHPGQNILNRVRTHGPLTHEEAMYEYGLLGVGMQDEGTFEDGYEDEMYGYGAPEFEYDEAMYDPGYGRHHAHEQHMRPYEYREARSVQEDMAREARHAHDQYQEEHGRRHEADARRSHRHRQEERTRHHEAARRHEAEARRAHHENQQQRDAHRFEQRARATHRERQHDMQVQRERELEGAARGSRQGTTLFRILAERRVSN